MIYKITPGQQEQILHMPETGMGYQVIECSIAGSYSKEKFIVFNAELAILMNEDAGAEIQKIMREGIQNVGEGAPTVELLNIRLYSEYEFSSLVAEPMAGYYTGAAHSPKHPSLGSEKMVRLSAFKNDKRIDMATNALMPGSYTTSLEDYLDCKAKNADPADRYALPNNNAIEWVFHIHPASGDKFQQGVVQPAFDKQGGGDEYYFEHGTSKNTYKPPIQTHP